MDDDCVIIDSVLHADSFKNANVIDTLLAITLLECLNIDNQVDTTSFPKNLAAAKKRQDCDCDCDCDICIPM